ncbi:hypothetical protein ACPCAB_30580 [Streptomyces koyangensis]|uniref:hypothetical protein n=1 Tax=Streptomyces koyangensis TaxID=188770 RepID=UPI003C2BFA30
MTGRRVAAVLLALLVVTTGAPTPTALAAPAAPTAPDEDPCDLVLSDAVEQYCREGHERLQEERERQEAGEDSGGGAGDACPDGPAGALCRGEETSGSLDTITGDCKAPPDPDFPGTGISGWIDPGPVTAPPPRKIESSAGYIYEQYGFAGLRWDTYDLGCGGVLRDTEAASDTAMANFIFMWSKAWTALTIKLHDYAVGDAIPDATRPVLENATRAVRNAIFTPWAVVSLLIVACGVIVQARKKNAADAVTRVGWSLLVVTLVAIVGGYPAFAAGLTDDAVSSTVGAVRQALATGDRAPGPVGPGPATAPPGGAGAPSAPGPDAFRTDREPADSATTATGNLLVQSVLYRAWMRGQFGDPDSVAAQRYGMQILDAQAMTHREARQPPAERRKSAAAKAKVFEEVAEKIKTEDPTAYAHFTGKKKERLGVAFSSMYMSFSANAFSVVADFMIAMSRILLPFIVVLFPAIAVIGLHWAKRNLVTGSLNAALAGAVNVPLFAAAGGVHGLVVAETVGRGSDTSPEWLSSTIALISGVVLWRLTAPMRRLASMASSGGSMWADATGRPKMAGRLLGAYAGSRALRRVLGRGHTTTAPDDTDLPDAPQPAGRDGRSGPAHAEPDRPLDLPAPRRGEGDDAQGDGSAALPGTDRGWMPTQRTTDADEWWEAPATSSTATESGAADWWTPPEPTTEQPAPGPSPSTSSATPSEPDPAARSGWTTTPPTPGAEPVTLATVAAESTTTPPSSSTAATDDEAGGVVVYTPSRGYEVRPPLTPSTQLPLPLPEMEPDADA